MGSYTIGPHRAALKAELLEALPTDAEVRELYADSALPPGRISEKEPREAQLGALLTLAEAQGPAAVERLLNRARERAPAREWAVLDQVLGEVRDALRQEGPRPPSPVPWWRGWMGSAVGAGLGLAAAAALHFQAERPEEVSTTQQLPTQSGVLEKRAGAEPARLTPLTVVWVEAGAQGEGIPDPTGGTAALRRYLGGHLLPALAHAGVVAIALDISLHPDGGDGELEPYRRALALAHGRAIPVVAPWPSGAARPLIDECATPGRGPCFDRLVSTWVGEGSLEQLPTCHGGRPSLGLALAWLLPRVGAASGGALPPATELVCNTTQVKVSGPLPEPRPWQEVSSRAVLEGDTTALAWVSGRVVLIGVHSPEDVHTVKSMGGDPIAGALLHALAAWRLSTQAPSSHPTE